jgi:sugar lactone lactonase YvrE
MNRAWFVLFPTLALAVSACGNAGSTAASTTPSAPAQVQTPFARGGPDQIVFDPTGNLYGVDCADAVVFRIDTSGGFTIVGGTGQQGFSGDGGPAVKAQFACPSGIAVAASGDLYVGDHGNNRIRRIDRSGKVSEFAGSGPIPPPGFNQGAFGGDGGPADHALFHQPVSLAFDASGNLYVSDRDNGAVRKITPKRIVNTVAGTGERGFSGDGGLATQAKLDQPYGIAFDAAGNMYIADSANNRVRRVDRNGVITTVAGTGTHGYAGDGGPATSALLSDPDTLTFDSQGSLYVAEPDEGVVRMIDSRGIITTVAGGGRTGDLGDGGPATMATLDNPYAVAFDRDGNLYIGDHNHGRVRKVISNGIISTFFNGRA